ncbi:hypothetical protein PZBJ_20135 [Pantoea endophytica]|uniref:Uncharacterized protein n=1 Tax=Pantoea endophytica TaxID=92488 RepID=A0ABX4SL46_9GAMM|nr:hypothetical protein [Pantoea endophytica]PLR20364.1 hypothetical protein PZBJ_20135 [Pantoea endophytica]
MINPDDIKAGYTLGHADAQILRDAVKELLALRKAFSEPAAWVNRTDVEQFEPHILAKRSKSLACTLPLYRKPIDSAT